MSRTNDPLAARATHPSEGASGPVADALRKLRSQARAQLLIQRMGMIVAAAVGVVLVLGLLDYLLRFPAAVRWGFWALGLSALVVSVSRRILPVLSFRPSLTEMALRAERASTGRRPVGLFASGIELSTASAENDLARALAAESSREAEEKFEAVKSSSRLLNPSRLLRALGALVLAGLPVVALTGLSPSHARIGSLRVLTPWTSATWPKRTGVIDANAMVAHPAGQALPLRALLTRSQRAAEVTDVRASFRVIVNGEAGPSQRALLASQRRRAKVDMPAGGPPAEGSLFERLVDVSSLIPQGGKEDDKVEVEYSFETEDDATAPWRVLIVQPPAVRSAEFGAEPPAYLAQLVPATRRDAGPGRDDRAVLGPLIAGSRVELKIELNKPLPVPENPGDAARAFAREFVPALAEQQDLTVSAEGTRWTFAWTARQSVRAAFSLRDEFGIASVEESTFRVDVVEDRPASATIVDPPQDESVLATAVVDVTAEGRDDVGVMRVGLTRQTARKRADSAGAPAEASEEPTEISVATPPEGASATLLELRTTSTLAIAELGVSAGDEVWLTSQVLDLLGAGTPQATPVRSPTRRLRIISESTFAEQIQAELSSVREAAKRLATEQRKLGESRDRATHEREAAAEQVSRQDAISDRITPMDSTVSRLTSRVERNNPADSALSQLLRDVAEAAKEASQASREAGAKLDELSRREQDEASPEQAAALQNAQANSEKALEEIVRMLDRGRDGWAARRSLERLITEQKQLTDRTRAAGQETQGKTAEQLTAPQREELNTISQRQQELSQRTRALIDSLEEQSKQMKSADPGQAQSMENAAQQGRRDQTPKMQEDAAEQLKQNQTGSAQQQQQQAAESLEKMLNELERAEQRRDEALRRTIAQLVEALERVKELQTAELDKLGAEIRGQPQEALDRGMIAVNQATAGASLLVAPMDEPGRLPELLESASNAQGAAISVLRAKPRDLGEADANERRSLTRINEAIEEAKKLDADAAERAEERAREELAKVYQEALEAQITVNAETDPLIGKAPGRRERVTLRALAEEQERIRAMLEELRTKSAGLEDAKVFDYAHTRLEQSMKHAVELMRAPDTSKVLKRDQATAARVLGSLVQALKNSGKKDDELRDNESGDEGGGGGSGSGGQPPLVPPGAELKLLRMMQQEAMDRTRELGGAGAPDAEELDAITRLQSDLHQKAKELIEMLNGGAPKTPPGDAKPAEDPS